MQRLLTLWLALSLLIGSVVPAGRLAAQPCAADEGGAAPMAMQVTKSADSGMAMSQPCVACDASSSAYAGCAGGSCVHASCSLFLPLSSPSFRDAARRSPVLPIIVATFRSHHPDLPKRPPIA